MEENNKNLILAIALSMLILGVYQYFYIRPHQDLYRQQMLAAENAAKENKKENAPETLRDRAEVIKDDARVPITTPELRGSINLKGARLDDLSLVQYRQTVDQDSPNVVLLSPHGSATPYPAYYADFGWLSMNDVVSVPTAQTTWKADSTRLVPGHPVNLSWDNGHGLKFERAISVDEHFMFTITDSVRNDTPTTAFLHPFSSIARQGNLSARTTVHEGGLGVFDGRLDECTYDELTGNVGFMYRIFSAMLGHQCEKSMDNMQGWTGFTDKYWMVTAIPPQDEKGKAEFLFNNTNPNDTHLSWFQTDFRGAPIAVENGKVVSHTTHFFAGVKLMPLLNTYEDELHIPLFDRAIDFGIFFFLTKPFVYLLDFLGHTLGSFGLAILFFTVGLKLLTLPLSLKVYHSAAKMRALQPEIARIKERYPDDKMRQGQETMEFYKRQNINPFNMMGCLPQLIQIPIFIALYKALYVDISMRQTPFYGWIRDMSVPDPTTLFNLFGLLPFTPPAFLHVGAWAVLLGLSMFILQKMSPQPPDKSQARMMMFMPLLLTYFFAQAPAGLVIYWTWGNIISMCQQAYIMKKDAQKKRL